MLMYSYEILHVIKSDQQDASFIFKKNVLNINLSLPI